MNYRALLDATIPAEPPPRDTVDAVIARGHRRLRVQRVAVTAGGLAVVAVATAGGFALASGPQPSVGPVVAAAPTPAPSIQLGVEPTESAAHAIARLEAAIPEAIRDAVPGVDLGGPVTVERRTVPASETGDGGTYAATFFYETPAAPVRVAGKRVDLSVSLMRRYVPSFCPPADEDSQAQALLPSPDPVPAASCEVTAGPNGERVVTTTIAQEGLVRMGVWVDRADGSGIGASQEGAGGALLTAEQLRAIALDPRVTFY